ncbi:MAG: hypothetical protein ACRER5_20660 [Pseudomonas sp.]
MKKLLALTAAASLALSGCATTGGSPFGSSTKAPVSAEQKAEARQGAVRAGAKGCAVGAATAVGMGLVGKLLGFGGGLNMGTAVSSCVVGGVATGVAAYQSQLNDFRALQGKVSVGAIATVKEKDVVVDGKATKAAENLTLNLDAVKVAARSTDILMVLSQLSATLNKQSMDMTVSIAGSASDRAWLMGQLTPQLKNPKVKVESVVGTAPVIVVSPMPR